VENLDQPSDGPNVPPTESVMNDSLTIDEFVRRCVRDGLMRERPNDPFFADLAVFRGDGPTDMAENHDEYLYGERAELNGQERS